MLQEELDLDDINLDDDELGDLAMSEAKPEPKAKSEFKPVNQLKQEMAVPKRKKRQKKAELTASQAMNNLAQRFGLS